MANGLASAGAAIGGIAGGPVGSIAGGLIGGAIGAIPALIKSDAEKENKRRLEELKRMQEMGTLGLTEAEKQAIYTAQQGALQSQLQQAQTQIRAAGAAGMGTGAGAEQLRQLQLAEQQTRALADVARDVERRDLERKRELEQEIQDRIAAKSEYKQERVAAITDALTAGAGAAVEGITNEMTQQNMAKAKVDSTDPAKVAQWAKQNPWASSYTPEEQSILMERYNTQMPAYGFFR